jgi:hypothetical protein
MRILPFMTSIAFQRLGLPSSGMLATWKIRVPSLKAGPYDGRRGSAKKQKSKTISQYGKEERLRRIFWKPFMQLIMESQQSVNHLFGPSGSSNPEM